MTPGAAPSHRSALRNLDPVQPAPAGLASAVPAPPAGDTVGSMRAIEYSITGDPDVLSLVERPVPDPGPGEVRVRIHRSGVNPTDWKSRRGEAAGCRRRPAAGAEPGRLRGGRGRRAGRGGGPGRSPGLGLGGGSPASRRRHRAGVRRRAGAPRGAAAGRRVVRPRGKPRGALPDGPPVPDRHRGRSDAARPGHAGGAHRPGGRRGGCRRQRRDPARPVVRRHGDHHGERPREGAPRRAGRRRPRDQLPAGRTWSPRSAPSRRTA